MKDKELNSQLIRAGWDGDNPQIDEVIDACDDKLKEVLPEVGDKWLARPWYPKDIGGKEKVVADTPEAAVVKFYLALKRHEKKNQKDLDDSKGSGQKVAKDT